MHILVTNDDGPPSPESSPYVHCLVQHLQLAGHVVSVCLPHTQRSWIGKAHMIGQTLKPFYYRPGSRVHGDAAEATTHRRPSPAADVEEWILIDGTPASCVQIGLHHFFHDRGPVDLVVSGPNYGRNTSSVFALSSGTLGAALEAAVCRRKSIALSFAFFSRNHDPVIIEGACRHSVLLIEALYGQWPADGSADLYSVNVPLVEGVETHKTLWTDMLQNYWMDGSCFQEVEGNATNDAEEEVLIREGPGGEVDDVPTTAATSSSSDKPRAGHVHKHFKWAPRLADVYKSVADSDPGNDGRTVREGNTSITPLKANFAQGDGAFSRKEFVLSNIPGESDVTMADLAIRDGVLPPRGSPVRAIVAYAAGDDDDDYVQPLIIHALKTLFPGGCLDLVTGLQASVDCFSLPEMLVHPDSKVLQISSYEAIDFQFATVHSQSCLVNSYMIRKALIRKHYLSATVDHWVAKKPESPLGRHVKRSEAFELDYAEFLQDALVEAFDLRESMERNAALGRADQGAAREWWILKPGMSDRGHGIRLFSTMDELQAIFDVWDADLSANDDDDNSVATEDGDGGDRADGIMTSHLRHFVAQPYIHPPLLLGGEGARKFHIRTYVLATGCLSVHVYRPMLALFASSPYLAPWAHAGDAIDTFITNTCLHEKHQNRGRDGQEERLSGGDDDSRVRRFWDLPLPRNMLDAVFAHICHVTGELFEAAATTMPVHFQMLPNAFEVFGMDFLLDERAVPWLLEVNAFPDFKQTGPHLQTLVDGFWRGVVREAVLPFFALPAAAAAGPEEQGDMVLVKKIDLGRRS